MTPYPLPSNRQMSEAFPTMAFLTLSGGLQDAYSYCVRGKVFANAQTGNIVLMSQHCFERDWTGAVRYLIPILAFAFGVFVTDLVRIHCQRTSALHWRQLVVLGEVLLLLAVGFFPAQWDFAANALVSFSCAMQVQAFRKLNGHAFASTMCIGNLRSGVEAFAGYLTTKDQASLRRSCEYLVIILFFFLGAGLGGLAAGALAERAIWFSCALLLVSFAFMFIPPLPTEKKASRNT